MRFAVLVVQVDVNPVDLYGIEGGTHVLRAYAAAACSAKLSSIAFQVILGAGITMTPDEKLRGVAEVLLMAAAKIREVSDTADRDGYVSRETSLAIQIVGIAYELKALAQQARQNGMP